MDTFFYFFLAANSFFFIFFFYFDMGVASGRIHSYLS